ncbi:hypothetical protein JOD17_003213 [Geomicrobium sediminis]|uniref:DUF2283 domain-containing protein n=1 Tax=Geomicrobium sediminis TaxID=1347788 RepID=A0ABS2PFC0_9BACL|nr:hypothetical protein [Geomicrobium sediminis]
MTLLYDESEDMLYVITNNANGRGNPIEEDDRLLRFPAP